MCICNKTCLTRLRGWIKTSCRESMRFWKVNIHISNVINTLSSLLLTVVRRSRSGGWRRTFVSRAPLIYVSLESLFTGAKEAKIPLLKENQSSLGLYRNLPTFSFTNPRFVLLICDRPFVLSPCSSLITQCRHRTSSAGTASAYHRRRSEREVFIRGERGTK